MCKPYTYYLYHHPTGKHYYGVQFGQYAHPSNLWSSYFSSSTRIHRLIEEYGINSFSYQIRKVFDNPQKALNWERKFLNRINAKGREDWINCSNGDGQYVNKGGYKLTEEQRKARSGKTPWNKGVSHSEETKAKLSAIFKNRPAWNKGITMPEHLKKLHSKMMSGENNPMFGKSAAKGRKWYTNGVESKFLFPEDIIPEGFHKGRNAKWKRTKK